MLKKQHDTLDLENIYCLVLYIERYLIICRLSVKNWWKRVKKPLGITADFYSLKHLHTSEIVAMAGDQAAADHNAHTSTGMVKTIYDVGREKREHEKVKKAGNKFA